MASVTLNDLVRYSYPNAVPLLDYAISNPEGTEYISKWNDVKLGQQPTVNALELNRATVQATADASQASEAADVAAVVQILAVADDMINGVGTTAQRQARVESALGRLIKRLAKKGVVP